MEVQPDFKELLRLLNSWRVEYIIIGGYALAFHGAPRYTGDIDILVKPTLSNAEKIMSVLKEFGFGSVGLEVEDFQRDSHVVQLGVPPVRVDILTSISGVSIEEAFSNCADGNYGDIPVRYIGRELLIRNKRASCRKKDVSDLESLGEE